MAKRSNSRTRTPDALKLLKDDHSEVSALFEKYDKGHKRLSESQKQHLARLTQLINKSNQFNLTTVRRTQDEVEALSIAKDALVLGMDIKDKYGDYGLVGVSILKKEDKACIIDTLLMSCRVLGRGAEDTFIAKLAEAAKTLDCDEMRGKYIPTNKNAMVKDLYKRFKFIYDSQTDEWIVNLSNAPQTPAHIDVELRLSDKNAGSISASMV